MAKGCWVADLEHGDGWAVVGGGSATWSKDGGCVCGEEKKVGISFGVRVRFND